MRGVEFRDFCRGVASGGGADYFQRKDGRAGSVVIHAVPVEQAAERYAADGLTGGLADCRACFCLEPVSCFGAGGGDELGEGPGGTGEEQSG